MTATPIQKSSDADLLARIARGDEEAFSAIVDRYARLVEGAARVSGLDASESPDVVQAVFIVLWNQRKSLPAVSKVSNWLHGVARKLAMRHIRTSSRARRRENNWHQQQESMSPSHADAGDALVSPEARLALYHSLNKLGSSQRQILIARFWEQKPFAAIGRELGCSEDAAKKRFGTAVGKVRRILVAAGLVGVSSASVSEMLAAEAAAPANCAAAAHGSRHSASAAARSLAGMWKPGPPLATVGLICGAVATLIIACMLAMHSAGGDPPATAREKVTSSEEPGSVRMSSRRSARSSAAVPLSKWTSGEPTVLLECPADAPGKRLIWHLPMPITWLNGVPMVPVISGLKTDATTFHLFAPTGGEWEEALTIEGFNLPKLVALSNGTLGIVGHNSKDPSGAYGASLFYYTYDPETGVSEPWVLATPWNERDRITMVGLQELPDQQLVGIILLEPSKGAHNSLLEVRSADGGKTWSEPVERMRTTMTEDTASAMGLVSLGDAGLGVFNQEGNGRVEMLVASPDGGEWQARQLSLADGLPDTVGRIPLKVVADGPNLALGYLAMGADGVDGAGGDSVGTYHLARSTDAGTTWTPGKPIASNDKVNDLSIFFDLSASGNRLIASYPDTGGAKWTKGEFRTVWTASDDGGDTWFDLPGTNDGALLGTTSLAPSGNRAYASEVVPGADGSETFQVREFHPADP